MNSLPVYKLKWDAYTRTFKLNDTNEYNRMTAEFDLKDNETYTMVRIDHLKEFIKMINENDELLEKNL